MKNRELFLKDPLSVTLRNEGVSSNNNDDAATLEYELSTFVCDGEYQRGLAKILQGFLDRIGKEQTGAWVSGFYGSGKSHLVKVLRFLFIDHKLPNGVSSRQLCSLPQNVRDLFTELSTRGVQFGGLHSAGGTLKAGAGDVRLRVLSIVFKSSGLPEKYTHARFVMDLRDDGKLDAVKTKLVALGKHLDGPGGELEKLYVSKALHEAYLEAYPHLHSVDAVARALREQYPARNEEISIQDMSSTIKRALTRNGQFPLTVLILDEVQQFINDDAKIANDIQEVAEMIQKSFDGKLLLVATGQSALSDTPALQKIMGRFFIKVHLKDNDVEKVVRTVVLQKAPDKSAGLDTFLTQHSGEITRQLKTTRIATRGDDHSAYVPDYPLLPVRRRFWEQVLRSTDPSGTASQMRTQLRVTHEACRSVADKPVGTVIPGDFLYDQLAADLVISGEMQKRFQETIEAQKKESDGQLRARICSLIFLINKLPRESGVDIGLRANAEHIVDLLVENIHETQTPGEELAAAQNFVVLLKSLMEDAGGEPPAPVRPQSPIVTDIQGLSGNDLLHSLFSHADVLIPLVKEWKTAAKRIQERLPGFTLAKDLLARASAASLPVAAEQKAAFEAVVSGRQLLLEPDPAAPIRSSLSAALREALNAAHALHESRLNGEAKELHAQPAWSKLPESERLRLLEQTGAISRPAPAVGTDAELLDSLNRCDLAGWRTQTDAISARCNAALDVAIRAATPTAKRVKLPSATIHDEAELEAWLARAKAAVVETLKDGPATV